jgi:hypothetical protein
MKDKDKYTPPEVEGYVFVENSGAMTAQEAIDRLKNWLAALYVVREYKIELPEVIAREFVPGTIKPGEPGWEHATKWALYRKKE